MGCSSNRGEEITSSRGSQEQACSFRGNPRQSGGASSLAEIKLQEGESIENALRRFKRKVQQEDIIKDIKKHSFYLKPGDKRRAKQALARKRSRKKLRREGE
jgi:small subunit ribosomal protein S21